MGKLITIIALLAVSVASFVMYVRPTYDHVTTIKEKIARLDEALSKTRNIRRIRESLSSRFAEFSEENLARLQKMLPDHVDNVRLVLDMDGVASQYGMRLKNVSVQKSEQTSASNTSEEDLVIGSADAKEGSYQSLVLQFNVEATYEEFIQFLQDLESSLRIVDLTSFSMNAVGESDELKYAFNLALRTYWLK